MLPLPRPRRATACLALLLASCGGGTSETDAGASVTDAPLSPEALAAIPEIVSGLALATTMTAPLAGDGEMRRRDLGATDATAQTRIESGFSTNSVVTPSTCAAYTWSGATASVVLTGCTLESTGTPISGTVSLAVTLRPTTFTISFTSLSVGGSTFDGSLTLHAGGTDLMAVTTVDASLTYTNGTSSFGITATGLTVAADPALGVSVSGSATFTSGATTTSLVATGLTWAPMECLPSSGTLMVSGAALPLPGTITFLDTTPTDGIVTLAVPPLPSSSAMLFSPCP